MSTHTKMAAPMASPLTPRRVYLMDNVCVVCGFSFVITETTSDGKEVTQKRTDQKLRLTEERKGKIKHIIPDIEFRHNVSGICQKCYRVVERVHKITADALALQEDLAAKYIKTRDRFSLTLRSPQQTVQKRLLRSPQQPAAKMRSMPGILVPISPVKAITIKPFDVLIEKGAPKPPPTDKMPFSKPVRRSLQLALTENIDPGLEVEVEISIFNPSGKRTTIVTDETHQKICKAIFRKKDTKAVVDILKTSNPDDLVDGTCHVIATESRDYCKRGSGAILQNRTYESIMEFTWDRFYSEVKIKAPNVLKIVSAVVSDITKPVSGKQFQLLMHTVASGLHARNLEMSAIHYQIAFILMHGGCTQHDITRLSKVGVCVTPQSARKKLLSWRDNLSQEVMRIRNNWANGGSTKYQLVGDNWDKNILPSFRTSQQKTISLHLFNVVAVVDRVNIAVDQDVESQDPRSYEDISLHQFLPSVEEQMLLKSELTFILARSLIENIPQLNKIFKKVYPAHLVHKYSEQSGLKTTQYPLGLYDCNETKTTDVIKLLKELQEKFVPFSENGMVEPVFFGGDRLTDERIQGAQEALRNGGATPKDRLEGFISKIEDFHRLMNFLEAICRLAYSSDSGQDRGTLYYYRNMLDARSVKGEVKNAYRAYKHLCYTVLDAMCCALFFKENDILDISDICLPENINEEPDDVKISWINNICESILDKYFFAEKNDVFSELRDIITDMNHPENYWISNLENGWIKCHFCERLYKHIGSLKVHEKKVHKHEGPEIKSSKDPEQKDDLNNYSLMLFKVLLLHRNLDTAVDMGDGERTVRSAKYELPIYNLTNKTKYGIGSVHLIAMTEGLLEGAKKESLIANRFVNLQGGKNNNMALDEYVELLNRDSKNLCSGFQTKESIITHSLEFPHLINFVKHFDSVSNVAQRKGFHKLPSYAEDVRKVLKDLIEIEAFSPVENRSFRSRKLKCDQNIFNKCFHGLANFIHRHKPMVAYHRLRNPYL